MSDKATTTQLKILCRNGALSVTFRPALAPWQYDKLRKITEETDDKSMLRTVIEEAAKHWEIEAVVEDA